MTFMYVLLKNRKYSYITTPKNVEELNCLFSIIPYSNKPRGFSLTIISNILNSYKEMT